MYEYVYGCVAKIAEHSPYFFLRWYVTSTNPLTAWMKTRIITKLKETPPLESTYNSISHFFFSSLLSIFIVTFYHFFFLDFWVWLAHFLPHSHFPSCYRFLTSGIPSSCQTGCPVPALPLLNRGLWQQCSVLLPSKTPQVFSFRILEDTVKKHCERCITLL